MKPGIYSDISNHDYHNKLPGISSTQLKKVIDCPMKFGHSLITEPKRPTTDQLLGQLVHCLYLTPKMIDDEFYVWGGKSRRGKEYESVFAIASEHNQEVVLLSDIEKAKRIADAIDSNRYARGLMEGSHRERSHFADKGGILCKVRPDIENEHFRMLVDIKTTVSAKPENFKRDAHRYGYHISAAFYLAVTKLTYRVPPLGFAWIAVEKEPPYVVEVFEASIEFLSLGFEAVYDGLCKIALLLETDQFNGYSPEGYSTLEPPKWAMTKE